MSCESQQIKNAVVGFEAKASWRYCKVFKVRRGISNNKLVFVWWGECYNVSWSVNV